MFEWLTQLYDQDGLKQLIASGGLLLLVGIIFAETGILAGFFLPGDSLLITAGVFCALDPIHPQHAPPLDLLTTGLALTAAAIAGDQLNFLIGRWTGNRAWDWQDGRLFKRRHLEEAHAFYERWGGLAIAAGRFVPIVRTFVPFVAGIARMPRRRFLVWNLLGAGVWVWVMLVLGWWLAGYEVMRRNLHLLVLAIIVLSFVPVAIGVLNRWRAQRRNGRGLDAEPVVVQDPPSSHG